MIVERLRGLIESTGPDGVVSAAVATEALIEIERMRAALETSQAEVDMLRGVGCNEDGDGPCGACLKCARELNREASELAHAASMITLDDRARSMARSLALRIDAALGAK